VNTPIHLASVTKRITASAIMILVDAGKLELDQKVNTILIGFPYPDITVRTLLNHRSGLTNYAYYFDDRNVWDQQNQVTNQVKMLVPYFLISSPMLYVEKELFLRCIYAKFVWCSFNTSVYISRPRQRAKSFAPSLNSFYGALSHGAFTPSIQSFYSCSTS
jgi:hypothetical protein